MTYVGTVFTAFYGIVILLGSPQLLGISGWAFAAALLAAAAALVSSVGFWRGAPWRRTAFLAFGLAFPAFVLVLALSIPGPLPPDAPRAMIIGGALWALFITIIVRRMRVAH